VTWHGCGLIIGLIRKVAPVIFPHKQWLVKLGVGAQSLSVSPVVLCSIASTHCPPHEQWLMRLDVGAGLGVVSDVACTWHYCWCCKVSLIHPMSSGLWAWQWELHHELRCVVLCVVVNVVVSLSRLKLNEKVS
jgi:hypothetical protein